MINNLRPIPFTYVDTFFFRTTLGTPEWYVNDDDTVRARMFSSVPSAIEWSGRRLAAGIPLMRIVARGPNGDTYWVRDGVEPIRLDAFGVPDFVANAPAYDA